MRSLQVFFTKIFYLFKETWRGLRRGGWLNWAAVSTLIVLLFLVGISLQLSWGLESTLQALGSEVEISVFLDQDVDGAVIPGLIERLEGVESVVLTTKDQAWRDLLVTMGTQDPEAAVLELGTNPLVDSLRVKATDADFLATIAAAIETISGVASVQYGSEVLERLSQLRDGVRMASLTVATVLTLTTMAVIMTTIRLIAIVRRREIEVMALVGATPTWIYLPFIMQGIVFGVLGASFAWGLIALSQQVLGDVLAQMIALPFVTIATTELQVLPWILLGFGTLLGMISSLIAVQRIEVR